MTQVNANGAAHNATCSRCGQSLTHVFYFDGQPVGGDCFERLTGLPIDAVRDYIAADGTIDLAARTQKIAAQQAAIAAGKAEQAAQNARIAAQNQWLIDALMPSAVFEYHADGTEWGQNFAGSIVVSLRNGTLANELPAKAQTIIAKIVGGRSPKRRDEVIDRIAGTEVN
jgi:hypothetical protein